MKEFKDFILEKDKIWTTEEEGWKSALLNSIFDVEAMFLFGLNDSKLKSNNRDKYKDISAFLQKMQKSFDWKVIQTNVKKVVQLYKVLLKDIIPNSWSRIGDIKESLKFLNSILKMKEVDFKRA